MARHAVILRPATTEDLPVLLEMHGAMRAASPRTSRAGRYGTDTSCHVASQRYLDAMGSADHRLLLAIMPDGEIGGMTLLVRTDFSQTLDSPVIHVAQTCVRDNHRSRGVGRALVGAAALWAEESDSSTVVLSLEPGSRESHRYYARLGFAPMILMRSAPVVALRRAIGGESARPSAHRRRALTRPMRHRRAQVSEGLIPRV